MEGEGVSIIIAVFAITILYLYMIAPRMFRKPNRSVLSGTHYAHRGLFDNETDAPENSIAAIRKAVEAGYGIEFDVQLSKDDIPVVFHDASLKRMCQVKGKVCEYTLRELRHMKLAKSKEKIPTLEEVLEVVSGKVPLIIEYKMDDMDTKVCELSNVILQEYKGTYCIESFHPFAVRWYKKHRPDVIRGQLSRDFSKTQQKGIKYWLMTHLLTNFLTRPDFIAYHHKDARKISRRICKCLGALSVAWTIKNEEQYKRSQKWFDLVIFDSFIL